MYPINYQVILTLLCGWCRECYNHGNGSRDKHIGNTWKETIISVSTAWSSDRDRERSINFWKCLNDMHCTVQVNAIEQSNLVCVCTDGNANRLCTKISCSENKSKPSSVNMDCKYHLEFENASECSVSGELGEVVKMEKKQAAMRGNTMDVLTCSLSGKENGCNSEESISISKISVWGKNFTLKLSYLDLQSDCESEPEIFDQRTYDNGHFRNNISLIEVWSQWKVEILLACSGVVLCMGVIAIIVGLLSYKLRETKSLLTRAKRKQYQCHASQDYAEIRENMYQDQEEIVENIRVGMDQIETTPETTCSFAINTRESPSDDGYSNIYNVLQPNYGAKRHSYPSVVTEYEEKCYTYSYFRRPLTLGRKLPEA